MVLGTLAIAALYVKLTLTYPILLTYLPPSQQLPIPSLLTTLASSSPWHYFLPLCLAIGILVLRKGYTKESLLVIRGLGVQTSTSSRSYLSTASTRFIPTSVIQDIFIHEAFKGFEVKFYLAIVVEGEEDVVVVFPVSTMMFVGIPMTDVLQDIMPKRQMLEEVWRGTRACLYEPKA